jgi:hypothetical protein
MYEAMVEWYNREELTKCEKNLSYSGIKLGPPW